MTKTSKQVLIIEDEKPMAKALKMKFEHEGFSVTTADNGDEGLAILEKEQFDVILLDLIMPKKDGFKVMESLKKSKIKTPVCILTNLSQEEDREKTEELGAREFFVKSDISVADIVDRVKKLVG